jgi:two-component system cell cycle sensor histidine kinase/response regulator CckA
MTSRRAERDIASREAAHDLNNLLTAIICAADSALRAPGIDAGTREDLAHIREGARRGVALVLGHDANRDVAAPVVSVNATIRGTSRLLAHRLSANVNLVIDTEERDDLARIEPASLDRVLLNLVINAGRAMPAGGTVVLRTERRVLAEPSTGVPDAVPAGDYVAVTMTDSGTGIAKDRLPRIFERGFSVWREADGSGLGLASVWDCVRRSHGYLAVESVEGRGTRFTIFLPLHRGEPDQPAVPEPSASIRIGVVLLVEDDPMVRQIAERILRREGWTVLHADSAEAALDLLEETRCDLMIADIALPGMDGLALTEQARNRWPELPVVLTSGYALSHFGSEPPRVAFLSKPYGRAELLEIVSRVVEPVHPRQED